MSQCEPDFQYIEKSCYHFEVFEGDHGNWKDGITECDRRRAQLFTPISAELHAVVSNKAVDVMKSNNRDRLNWWTSLNDQAKEGKFEVYRISSSGATASGVKDYEELGEAGAKAAAKTPFWESKDIGSFFPWNADAVSPYRPARDRNCVALRTESNADATYIGEFYRKFASQLNFTNQSLSLRGERGYSKGSGL